LFKGVHKNLILPEGALEAEITPEAITPEAITPETITRTDDSRAEKESWQALDARLTQRDKSTDAT
jgi:hypothetical protein